MKITQPLFAALAVLAAQAVQAAQPADCDLAFLKDAKQAAAEQLACAQQMSADGRLAAVTRKDLDDVIDVVYPRSGQKGLAADAQLQLLMVAEAKRRRLRDPFYDKMVYAALISLGRFEEAYRVPGAAKLRVVREAMPDPAGAGDPPRLWDIELRPLKLVERPYDLSVGRHVVVYTSPHCGFCPMAARELTADPLVGGVFRKQSVWVHTPGPDFGPELLRAWPLHEYTFPTHVMFDRRGWPERRIPATPYFIFVDNGKVVGEARGWYKDSLSKMARQLADLGYLSP